MRTPTHRANPVSGSGRTGSTRRRILMLVAMSWLLVGASFAAPGQLSSAEAPSRGGQSPESPVSVEADAIAAVPVQTVTSTGNEGLLGKGFPRLDNPAPGWSTRFEPGSTFYWARVSSQPTGLNVAHEREVFAGALTHDDANANQDWQIRLGAGSQIYSIITRFGEVIGSQRTFCQSYWNDSVLQTTFRRHTLLERIALERDRERQTHCDEDNYSVYNKNGDIHQAGTYATDGISQSYYSPMLAASVRPATSTDGTGASVTTVSWPQAAHAPTSHESGLVLEQTITDRGDGVAEVTTRTYNFGSEPIKAAGVWAGFNGLLFDNDLTTAGAQPHYFSSTVDGALVHCTELLRPCPPEQDPSQYDAAEEELDITEGDVLVGEELADSAKPVKPADSLGKLDARKVPPRTGPAVYDVRTSGGSFGGYVALARPVPTADDPMDPTQNWGMALVFGAPAEEEAKNQVRLGRTAGPKYTLSQNDETYLAPGEIRTQTYYLVFDRLDRAGATAAALAAGQWSADAPLPGVAVEAAPSATSPDVRLTPVCRASLRGDGNGLAVCTGAGDARPLAWIYSEPVANSAPVFRLERAVGDGVETYLTADPFGRDLTRFSALEQESRSVADASQPGIKPWRVYDPESNEWLLTSEQGAVAGTYDVLRPYGTTTPTTVVSIVGYAVMKSEVFHPHLCHRSLVGVNGDDLPAIVVQEGLLVRRLPNVTCEEPVVARYEGNWAECLFAGEALTCNE